MNGLGHVDLLRGFVSDQDLALCCLQKGKECLVPLTSSLVLSSPCLEVSLEAASSVRTVVILSVTASDLSFLTAVLASVLLEYATSALTKNITISFSSVVPTTQRNLIALFT